jgi:hypothetical protein
MAGSDTNQFTNPDTDISTSGIGKKAVEQQLAQFGDFYAGFPDNICHIKPFFPLTFAISVLQAVYFHKLAL